VERFTDGGTGAGRGAPGFATMAEGTMGEWSMKRFRWVSAQLVSVSLAAGAGCGHPSPARPADVKAACEPMGPEGYEYLRAAPPPSAEAWGKLHANALSMAQLVYERAHGDPATWDDPTDGFLRYAGVTCVPKEWRTSVWVKRGSFERIEAAGFRVHYGSGSNDSGSVTFSPSRLFEFASHPDVVRLGDSTGIGTFHYELDKSGAYIGAGSLRAAQLNATGAGTRAELIDRGIDGAR
jgi:hypothetical protein